MSRRLKLVLGAVFIIALGGLIGYVQMSKPDPCTSDKAGQEYSIESMKVEEVCYAMPWSMWLDKGGRFWLSPQHAVTGEPQGTSSMPVKRTQEGYRVKLKSGEKAAYSPVDKPGYLGQADPKWIPVLSTSAEEWDK